MNHNISHIYISQNKICMHLLETTDVHGPTQERWASLPSVPNSPTQGHSLNPPPPPSIPNKLAQLWYIGSLHILKLRGTMEDQMIWRHWGIAPTPASPLPKSPNRPKFLHVQELKHNQNHHLGHLLDQEPSSSSTLPLVAPLPHRPNHTMLLWPLAGRGRARLLNPSISQSEARPASLAQPLAIVSSYRMSSMCVGWGEEAKGGLGTIEGRWRQALCYKRE